MKAFRKLKNDKVLVYFGQDIFIRMFLISQNNCQEMQEELLLF